MNHNVFTKLSKLLAVVILSVAFAGCGNKEEATPDPKIAIAQQNAEVANALRIAAEQKAAEAEKQKQIAEDSKSAYQMTAIGLVIVVLMALFIGIAMGSSTRKDAGKQRKDSNG